MVCRWRQCRADVCSHLLTLASLYSPTVQPTLSSPDPPIIKHTNAHELSIYLLHEHEISTPNLNLKLQEKGVEQICSLDMIFYRRLLSTVSSTYATNFQECLFIFISMNETVQVCHTVGNKAPPKKKTFRQLSGNIWLCMLGNHMIWTIKEIWNNLQIAPTYCIPINNFEYFRHYLITKCMPKCYTIHYYDNQQLNLENIMYIELNVF